MKAHETGLGNVDLLKQLGLPQNAFCSEYYLSIYSDVKKAGIDAFLHYKTFGWREGRNPSAIFNTEFYLRHNPVVSSLDMDPVTHFKAYGYSERRATCPYNDVGTTVNFQSRLHVHKHGLAICATIKNEAQYLEEWVAFHVLQGVSAFLIFVDVCDDNTRKVLETLQESIDIRIIDCSSPFDNHDAWQVQAYDFGIRALVGSADFVAIIDVDEFLFGRGKTRVVDFLGGLSKAVSAIGINQIVFGSSGLVENDGGLVTTRFIRSVALDSPRNGILQNYLQTRQRAAGRELSQRNSPKWAVRACE